MSKTASRIVCFACIVSLLSTCLLGLNVQAASMENLALLKPIVGAHYGGYVVSRLNDGVAGSYWIPGEGPGVGRWMYIDLGNGLPNQVVFDTIYIRPIGTGTINISDAKIQVDGGTGEVSDPTGGEGYWKDLVHLTDAYFSVPNQPINGFGLKKARYIALYINSTARALLSEFQVYNATGIKTDEYNIDFDNMAVYVNDLDAEAGAATVLSKISLFDPNSTAVMKIYDGEDEVTGNEPVQDDFVLEVSDAQNTGTKNEYTIIIDRRERVSSDYYTVIGADSKIIGIPYSDRLVSIFKSKLSYASGAYLEIKNAEGQELQDSDYIDENCTVTVHGENPSTTYTIEINPPSSDVSISSNLFPIEQESKTIIVYSDKYDDLVSNIKYYPGATIEVLDKSGFPVTDTILTGFSLKITAEDGVATDTYEIIVESYKALVASQSYKINNDKKTITGIPFSDRNINDFLRNIEVPYGTVIDFYSPDGSKQVFGNLYSGCLVKFDTQFATETYTLTINDLEYSSGNLALFKPTTARGYAATYVSSRANDGNISTAWLPDNGDGGWIIIDLRSKHWFNKIDLYTLPTNPGRVKNFTLDCSDDLVTWRDIVVITDESGIGPYRSFEFDFISARYVRFTADKSLAATQQPFISEFEIYATENAFCELSSDVYSIDDFNNTVSDVNTTSAEEILSNVTHVNSGPVKILTPGGQEITSGTITSGYKLRGMSESGSVVKDYDIILSKRPEVRNLQVSGSTALGSTLKAHADYYSESGAAEDEIKFQWYKSASIGGPFLPIADANQAEYKIIPSDQNHYIMVRASAHSLAEPKEGVKVFSAFIGFIGDLAYGALASAQSGNPEYATDANLGTVWSAGAENSLTIEFDTGKTFNQVEILFERPIREYKYKLQYSADGVKWADICTRGQVKENERIIFGKTTAKYVRFVPLSNAGGLGIRNFVVSDLKLTNAEMQQSLRATEQAMNEYFNEYEPLDKNIVLPKIGVMGAEITWSSGDTNLLKIDGESGIVTMPKGNNKSINLYADISNGEYKSKVSFLVLLKGDGSETPPTTSPVSGGRPKGSGSNSIYLNPADKAEKPEDGDNGEYFLDLDGHWAKEYIRKLTDAGVISKNVEKRFYPDNFVTRAEFAKMITRAMKYRNTETEYVFSDVMPENWYYNDVMALYKKGIIKGKSADYFGADDFIITQDTAVMVFHVLTYEGFKFAQTGYKQFIDSNQISAYAKTAVDKLSAHEILIGNGEGALSPSNYVTRAQAGKLVCKIIEILEKEAGDLSKEEIDRNKSVSEDDLYHFEPDETNDENTDETEDEDDSLDDEFDEDIVY